MDRGTDTVLVMSRSVFMWYMWRVEDVDVSAIQDN